MNFSWAEIAVIVLGAATGGFVNGLTGFGTALTAAPIWLHVLSPASTGALGAAAGVIGQLQTLHQIWHAIEWRRVGHFIVAGLAGIPLGTWLLPMIEPRAFKLGVGLVLIAYCSFQLFAARLLASRKTPLGGRLADALVGFTGGVMGGMAGLSGPPVIIWASFQPWPRDQKRALFQAYNMTILSAAFCSIAAAGLLGAQFWYALALAAPATLAGVHAGFHVYRRLDDRRFDRLVMAILLLMGAMLVVGNI